MQTTSPLRLVVIGGGPGGYVAALRAAQLGASVTLIESQQVGGTCLNRGCIPTKALLHVAQTIRSIQKAPQCGVHADGIQVNWDEVQAYKQNVCTRLTGGVAALLRSAGVKTVAGTARLVRRNAVQITSEKGDTQILEADRIVLATGSVPVMPPIPGLRESRFVLDSTGVLAMKTLPKDITIIGGGVIGIETAAALQAFGCQVTLLEALPHIAPNIEDEMALLLENALLASGVQIRTGHRVEKIEDVDDLAVVTAEGPDGPEIIHTHCILCAIGRKPNLGELGAQDIGVTVENGCYAVNDALQTNVPGIYAVGDCTGQGMLAHTASAQGEIAAENALGAKRVYAPSCVPSCIYGMPEYAGVGLTEQQAKAQGLPYHVGRFPLSGNGRSIASDETDGMIKIIIGDELGEILGLHIVAANATEMIGEGTLAIHLEATAEEIINAIHPHPTMIEAIREATLVAEDRPLHIPNRNRRKANG